MYRKICLFGILTALACPAFSQKPEILVLDKSRGSLGSTVTLKGIGFGSTTPHVVFGATKADVISATDQVVQVKVPAGITYENITVTNTTSRLTGYTREQFLLNFNGENVPFNINDLEGQFDAPGIGAANGLYDLCVCDFNGDGKPDVATANDRINFVHVYLNTSTGPGNVAFGARTSLSTPTTTRHIRCGDLDGDGRPDLVVTEGGTSDRIFIFKNNTAPPGNPSFNFLSAVPGGITLTGRRPQRIEIADIDADGKPEIILTSQRTNAVMILKNESTTGITINSTPVVITITGTNSTDGLAVEDINGDGFPDIVTSGFQTNSNIYILENRSVPNTISFATPVTLNINTTVKNIRVGDLDGDGRNDIAYTQLAPSYLCGVTLNTSSSSGISFGNIQTYSTDLNPWGLDFGDLNGDGKPEIIVGSITQKSLTILNNGSVAGSAAFTPQLKSTAFINRHVVVADADSDGKSDIVFTSIDNSNSNDESETKVSKVSVFRNKTCMVPKISPEGPLHICDSNPTPLTATLGGGVSYQWTNVTTSSPVGTNTNTFTPVTSGTNHYRVTATSENNTCVKSSNTVSVQITPGTAGNPQPQSTSPVCAGQSLNLSLANNLGAGFSYRWVGPRGVVGEGPTVTVTNIRFADAGTYHTEIYAGDVATGCLAGTQSIEVKVDAIPDFRVAAESDIICSGNTKTLAVFPASGDFTYTWFEKNSGAIPGATQTTLAVSNTGEYYFKATASNPNCLPVESAPLKITAVSVPVVSFSVPAQACSGQDIEVTNSSSTDNQVEAFYTWTMGDGKTYTDRDISHRYTSTGSFTVRLTITYKDGLCPATTTQPISISTPPVATIISPDNIFKLCPAGTLNLEVKETFNTYTWSTGETTKSIIVKQPGDYSVVVKNSSGCTVQLTKKIEAFPAPAITITANPNMIAEGESSQLTASGLFNYAWIPAESLSDAAIPNPVAKPKVTTQYTVSGQDLNGCQGQATVEVVVLEGSVTLKLKPSNFFSPNGDATNPFWVVESIQDYPQCSVTIYDHRGSRVFTAKPYMNDWDGTFNGKRLPDGVYYYIIRCEGEEAKPKTGSITLLR